MNNKYFITTTLPYANGNPHIGHCLEFVQADFIRKYLPDSYLNIGLDEHGKKIFDTAEEKGITPKQLVDDLSDQWKEFCEKFDIKYDNFYRTSDLQHHVDVNDVWEKVKENNDIFFKKYSGYYCKNCEEFKSNKQQVGGKCVDHPQLELEEVEEENFFFKLSKYKDIYETFVFPENKRKELRNVIDSGEDVSVSRENLNWGIKVPRSNQTIYVWFEALCNYFLASDWNDSYNIQICGPDNLRFQGHFYQAILKSLGYKQTDVLLVHGTILDNEGNKMSKSVGNTIDPIDQLNKFGLIPLKYYLLKGLHTFNNSNFDEKALIDTYNSDLADNYGNLISRVVHLINTKKYEDLVPSDEYKGEVDQKISEFRKNLIKNWDIQSYFVGIAKLLKDQNQYINVEEPWKEDKPQVLFNILYVLKQVTELYKPLLGEDKIEEVLESINKREKKVLFEKIK